MPYTASDLRKGLKILFEGQPYEITEYQFTKPGKGQSIYTCRLKSILSENTFVKNFRENDVFEKPDLENKTVHYSYCEGPKYIFSDENYEEIVVNESVLGQKKYFLSDDLECDIAFFNGEPIEVEFPTFIERKVVKSDPAVKGNTAAGKVVKPATVEGGYELMVPIFVEEGDWIRIDTRTGEYADRIVGRK